MEKEDNCYTKIKGFCESLKNNGYKLHIIGFKNDGIIHNMKWYVSEGCFVTKQNLKKLKNILSKLWRVNKIS